MQEGAEGVCIYGAKRKGKEKRKQGTKMEKGIKIWEGQ